MLFQRIIHLRTLVFLVFLFIVNLHAQEQSTDVGFFPSSTTPSLSDTNGSMNKSGSGESLVYPSFPTQPAVSPLNKFGPAINVTFISFGLNFCNISAEYGDLLGDYYGYILYDMLNQSYSIKPDNRTRLSGNCFISLGFYPKSFF